MANVQRRKRVADEIQRILSELIRNELKDPRIGFVTITAVEVSPDIAHAKVYFTSLGDKATRTEATAGLNSSSGYLRRGLGQSLKVFNTPELHFFYDESVENGMRMTKLINEAVSSSIPKDPKKYSS